MLRDYFAKHFLFYGKFATQTLCVKVADFRT